MTNGWFGQALQHHLASSRLQAEGIRMDPFCLTVQLSAYARARPRQRERMEDAMWLFRRHFVDVHRKAETI